MRDYSTRIEVMMTRAAWKLTKDKMMVAIRTVTKSSDHNQTIRNHRDEHNPPFKMAAMDSVMIMVDEVISGVVEDVMIVDRRIMDG
jgi:hypothetical protein